MGVCCFGGLGVAGFGVESWVFKCSSKPLTGWQWILNDGYLLMVLKIKTCMLKGMPLPDLKTIQLGRGKCWLDVVLFGQIKIALVGWPMRQSF